MHVQVYMEWQITMLSVWHAGTLRYLLTREGTLLVMDADLHIVTHVQT